MLKAWINLVLYLLVIFVNYLANALPINGNTTGELSNRIKVLFTPASYVFSIWGLIYVLTGIWVLRQFSKKQRQSPVYRASFPLFSVSCILNISWILLWHNEFFILTVIVMTGLLLSLIGLYQKIKKCRHTFMDIAPFSIYLGWISVATITNIAYVLKNDNWNGFGLSDVIWTIILLLAAFALGVIFRFKNDDWLYPLVFVWAFIGIGVKNAEGYPQLAYLSYVLAAILFLAALVPLISRKSIRI